MKLTAYQSDIYNGIICPYCKSKTKVVSEEHIYGKSYNGKSMICCVNFPKCDSYCGTHKEDGSSLGRLADNTLRQYKKVTHNLFDKLWNEHKLNRSNCYYWLSEKLDLPIEFTHIGWFSIKTCKKVIKIFNDTEISDIINEILDSGLEVHDYD